MLWILFVPIVCKLVCLLLHGELYSFLTTMYALVLADTGLAVGSFLCRPSSYDV